MSTIDKIAAREGFLQGLERGNRWLISIFGFSLFGAISGWAARATVAVSAYAPLIWVAAAMGGGCTALVSLWAWSAWNRDRTAMMLFKDRLVRSDGINPLSNVFNGVLIDVGVFDVPKPDTVTGKTFVDCTLRGPAVITLLGNINVNGVSWVNCDFIKVREGATPYNAIYFKDVTITRGKMYNMTVLVPLGFEANFAGANWITAI